MSQKFIKLLLPLPALFQIQMSSDEEPHVFPVIPDTHDIPCPLCEKKTILHSKKRRRFRHGHAWGVGTLWMKLDVPRQRCLSCDLTFVYDYGLGLVRTSTEVFRKGITERCHGRTISDVAREYELPYTTVERWFYQYASAEIKKHTKHILVDEFATRKGHHYATIVLDAKNGRLLSVVPGRDVASITAALQGVLGDVRSVVSDFAPAMAKAVTSVFPDATHVLDRFHLIQFFTDALRRRRRFLNEARRHHHVRVIDRALACRPEVLALEDREVARSCLLEDSFTRNLYQGLQHIRYVLKATCDMQANRRLTDWLERFQFHPCGPLAKIAKAISGRKEAMRQTIVSALSNGKMEGTNNKIKLIKRRAYGYRNLERFFLRLRLELGR